MIPFCVEPWQLIVGEVLPQQIVDMRSAERFHRGHLPGARCLSYEAFQGEALTLLDRGQSVLVVDPQGARAAEMATWLRARGYDAGYLEGGMASWTGPLTQGPGRRPDP